MISVVMEAVSYGEVILCWIGIVRLFSPGQMSADSSSSAGSMKQNDTNAANDNLSYCSILVQDQCRLSEACKIRPLGAYMLRFLVAQQVMASIQICAVDSEIFIIRQRQHARIIKPFMLGQTNCESQHNSFSNAGWQWLNYLHTTLCPTNRLF